MKKIKLFPVCILFLLMATASNAQIIKGIGFMGGVTRSNHKWKFDSLDARLKKRAIWGFNAEGFVEWLNHDYIRIQTELQFNQKGAKENLAPNEGARYRTNYFCFNNFLKLRQELYDITPYFLIGPRVEYLFSSGIGGFRTIHVTGSAGAGIEWLYTRPWIIITELHYNPDIMPAYKIPPLTIRQNAWELRVGLKYEINRRPKCPPVYNPGGVKMDQYK